MVVYKSLKNEKKYFILEEEPIKDMSGYPVEFTTFMLFFSNALVKCDEDEHKKILSKQSEFIKTDYGYTYEER